MRRRRATPSRMLDVAATLAATLRRGGFPKLVFGTRAEPEYVMLVDRMGDADHQACLADEVVEFFHAQGVCMDRYVFDGDPRFCRHAPYGMRSLHLGPQSLELLFSRHPDARLVMFSDGSGLIDRYTGAPAAWLKVLLPWQMQVLVTPQPPHMWGLRERQLNETGITVLPLDGEGLHRLGEILRHERAWQDVPQPIRVERHKAYQRDIDLLLDRNPLPRSLQKALLDDLARDLGRDSMAWLAACAVYPEIHWAVTLTVGDVLHPGRRSAAFAKRLAQLSPLPWMRTGYMPDWLRAELVDRLTPEAEQEVRARLQAFLSLMNEDSSSMPTSLTLAISRVPPQSAWQDAKIGLAAWLTGRPPPGNIRDAIFLRFISGPRSRLAVDAGDMLVWLFYRKGAPLAGARMWPLLGGTMAAAVICYLLPPVQRITLEHPGVLVAATPRLIALSSEGTLAMAVSDVRTISTKVIGATISPRRSPCMVKEGSGLTLSLGNENLAKYVLMTRGGEVVRNFLNLTTCSNPNYRELAEVPTPLNQTFDQSMASGAELVLPSRDIAYVLCAGIDFGPTVNITGRAFASAAIGRRNGEPVACAYAPGGRLWIGISRTGVMSLVELPAGTLKGPHRLPAIAGIPRSIAMTDNNSIIAVTTSDGKVWISQDFSKWMTLPGENATGPVALDAKGTLVAFANRRREVEIWRLRPLPSAPAPNNSESKSCMDFLVARQDYSVQYTTTSGPSEIGRVQNKSIIAATVTRDGDCNRLDGIFADSWKMTLVGCNTLRVRALSAVNGELTGEATCNGQSAEGTFGYVDSAKQTWRYAFKMTRQR